MKNWIGISQIGASRITTIFFATIFGAVIFLGYKITPFYYSYFELHNQLAAMIAHGDTLKDEEIRKRAGKFIKDLQIPAEAQDLKIDRRDRHLKLSISYTEVLFIEVGSFSRDLWDFPFSIKVEGEF